MNYAELIKSSNDKINDFLVNVEGIPDDPGKRRRLVGWRYIPGHITNRSDMSMDTSHILVPKVMQEDIGYQTGSGNKLFMTVDMFSIARTLIPLLTEWEQVAFCGQCNGSSGGCPGYAPRFPMLHRAYDKIIVVVVHIDLGWSLIYTRGTVWKIFLTWADRLTYSYVNRILTECQSASIGPGSCRGKCKPCTVMTEGKCSKPKKRSFSMEATGVDCDMLHKQLYGEWLPWAFNGIPYLPTYMSRYAGLFATDATIDTVVRKVEHAICNDKSYIDPNDTPVMEELAASIPEISLEPHLVDIPSKLPRGIKRNGWKQWMYAVPKEMRKK